MIREAKVEDVDFIYRNILDGSKDGYFHPDFHIVEKAKLGLKENIRSIILNNHRLDGDCPNSRTFIYEKHGTPISFLILSTSSSGGYELWIIATEKKYQNKGYANKLLNFILKAFKNERSIVVAQCYLKSEIMIKMLKGRGFKQIKNDSQSKNLYRIKYED